MEKRSSIISVKDGIVTLSNPLGCRLVTHFEDGWYGLGTFYVGDVKLGGTATAFITEANVWENSRDRHQHIWPGVWRPDYRASRYEVLENTARRGVVRFHGRTGKLDFSVTITLPGDSTGFKIDYEIRPLDAVTHPLYVSVPFDNSAMEFVQYPYETPLTPPFSGHWYIHPRRSTAPFMFGCERIGGREYYVGVGYQLNQENLAQGKLQYDATKPNPFEVYFTSEWLGTYRSRINQQRGGSHRLSMVVSTARSQYDCVRGYMDQSGYDISTPIRRTIDDSVTALMRAYRDTKAYVDLPPHTGKGYHQRILHNGEIQMRGYGQYIPIGVNVQLAHQLYRYWERHREEAWARERAIAMAAFFVESQNEEGAVPTLWSPAEKRFRAYRPEIDEKGFLYATCQLSMGAYSLHRLGVEREAVEKADCGEWKKAAVRAMDYIVDRIGPDGLLGRSYNDKGEYDDVCAANWPLVALDYFYGQTGDDRYDRARARLEKWVYENFARTNNWYGWSSDGGGWHGVGPSPLNHDAFDIFTFATYCAYRHMRTKDEMYLEMAKHVISYTWLCTVPVQYPGYRNVTRGLSREQDYYMCYDIPFRTCNLYDCLPYLSAVTGDRFFVGLYRMLIQTQMAYQLPTTGDFPAFHIGLAPDASEGDPDDVIGEWGGCFIVEFASLFLESVTSLNAYRYVGGRDWGVGLDYDLPFTPRSGPGDPYVISSSTDLISETWDSEAKTLSLILSGNVGDRGTLRVWWNSRRDPVSEAAIELEGRPAAPAQNYFDATTQVLSIDYVHRRRSLTAKICSKQ